MRQVLFHTLMIIQIAGFGILVGCSSDKTDTETRGSVAEVATTEGSATQAISMSQKVRLDPSAVSWTAPDIDGNLRSSSEWIGKKPVVINFWGTWCPPCRREIPDLVRVYEEYKPKGVEIISFALRDTPEKVRSFAAQANMDWVMLMGGDNEILVDYNFGGSVPTTIFLDRTGKEVGRFVGPRNYQTFKQAFEAIL